MEMTFPIEPASNAPLWVLIPLGLVLLGILGLMTFFVYSVHNLRVVVEADAIEVKGDLYGRRIPLSDLIVGEARIVDLRSERDYAPRWRTNGIGLPGYSSGWFRLRNGKRALAFITRRDRVVLIPTRRDFWLLLSPRSPDEFLSSLGTSVDGRRSAP